LLVGCLMIGFGCWLLCVELFIIGIVEFMCVRGDGCLLVGIVVVCVDGV